MIQPEIDVASVAGDNLHEASLIDRRSALALLAFGGIPILHACSAADSSSTIRYRMTVEIDTPEGVRTGASVMQVTVVRQNKVGGHGGISQFYRGEGVAVDLPGGQTLFALLTDKPTLYDYPAYLVHRALLNGKASPPLSRVYGVDEWLAEEAEVRQVKPTIVLAPTEYPFLVRFHDLRDPRSVEAVNPRDLARSFGPGFGLRRIFITITDEDPTVGISKRLPWLEKGQEEKLYGSFEPTINPTLSQLLNKRDFRRDSIR